MRPAGTFELRRRTAEPFRIDVTDEEIVADLDPGWSRWTEPRGGVGYWTQKHGATAQDTSGLPVLRSDDLRLRLGSDGAGLLGRRHRPCE